MIVAGGLFSQLVGGGPLIGLDIGSHTIKGAQVDAKRGIELTAVGTIPTPPGSIENGIIVDRQAVADAIGQLIAQNGFKGTDVAAAVTDPSLFVQPIQLPRTPDKDLRRTVMFEARAHVPFDISDCVVEYQVLDPKAKGPQMRVLLVVVRREAVDSRVEAIVAAGLNPVIVDAEQFASMRSQIYGHRDAATFAQTIALIRIGASFTEMTMVRNGAFVLPRTIAIAGNSLTKAIASAMRSDPEQAEAFKLEHGIAATREEAATLEPTARQVSQLISPTLEEIVRDVRRSFNFLAAQFQLDPSQPVVNKVVLTGGTARLRNLDRYLEAQLGARVEMGDVFRDLAIQTSRFDPALLAQLAPIMPVAMGLALTTAMQSRKYPFSGQPLHTVPPQAGEAQAAAA
jgi:type IV pilus assembly protein PilM